jgi:peptidoglycan hydrolase-like protein with peptidoglycan-binding domain
MGLQSRLFARDPKLEAAAVSNPAHIVPGAVGDHVGKIQQALRALDGAVINSAELDGKRYGPSTANAVLSYKRKRNIINRSYQTQADDIVGIMTIAALDKEMFQKEQAPVSVKTIDCRISQDLPGRTT